MKEVDLSVLSLETLEQTYNDAPAGWGLGWPSKLRAEVSFALAVAFLRRSAQHGNDFLALARARKYAGECIGVLRTLPRNTLHDVAPTYTTLVGVTLPNYLYVEYVTDPHLCREFCALL